MCHAGDLQDRRHRTEQAVPVRASREAGTARLAGIGRNQTMSSHSAKKTRAPRTPYVPPAARRSANAGNTSDNLSCQQDDSSIGKPRRRSAVGEEGARGLRGANEPGQRAGVVRAGRSPGKGKTSSQRRAQGTDAEGRQARPEATAATTATTAAAAAAAAAGAVAPKITTPGGPSPPPTAVPNGRPSAAKKPKAKLTTPSATDTASPANKRDEKREQEPRDDFQRQCSVMPASSDTDTCHEPPALEATNNEAPQASVAGTERARGEIDPVTGKGRRKPRQAWSQYVPPKRRGSPSSGSATAGEAPQPAFRHRSTASAANAAAVRVYSNNNSGPSAPSLGSTSSPPGDSCSTVNRDAESCPALATSGNTIPKAASSDLTSDVSDLSGANGAIDPEDFSTAVVAHGTTPVDAAPVGTDHQQQCDDRSAETEPSVVESQQLQVPAQEKVTASVAQAPTGLLPAGHAGAAGATGNLLGRSDDDCCHGSVDVGASPNQRGTGKSERSASGGASEANSATPSAETTVDSIPKAMAEEAEVTPGSTPVPSFLQASASAASSGSGSGSNVAARNRAPTSQSARDRQSQTESAGGTTTSGSEVESSHTLSELGGDANAGTASGGNAAAGRENGSGDNQELTAAKAPSARYVPPGRRKLIDAEVAAINEGGSSGTGTAGGMGPLWTSRAPIRVSQRARPSDRESSPARPSPARVAGVVSGGMSAYGANISEYSEHMSRDQVESCTALVSNFPSALPPGQRDLMLQPFVALGGLVVWPRPDEALVTFATPALARQAVSNRHNRSSVLLVEALSEAREEKRRGYRRVELARPGRPPADASSASRLISGALGIRRPRAKPSVTPTRKGAATGSSKGGVRGRGASTAVVQPAECTDSWDM